MTQVAIPGGGQWFPAWSPEGFASTTIFDRNGFGDLDTDQKECQFIGQVQLSGGSGSASKTFGTSGSGIGFLPGGGSVQLVSVATLRVGVKKASSIDLLNGPPARATIGNAAFDVYKDLTGGVDTVSAVIWKDVAMASGTPFTVNHGDMIAACFTLNLTTGTQLINFSAGNNNGVEMQSPTTTLVTAGPTYTNQTCIPILRLTFDDGSIGWLAGSICWSTNKATVAVGNTNIYGNIFSLPMACKIDAIRALVSTSSTTNFDMGFWSTPLGTPAAISGGTISVDPQVMGSTGMRFMTQILASPISITAATNYFAGVKQNSATAVTLETNDVSAAGDLAINGLDSTCYAGLSTAGGSVASQNSGKRRTSIWFRVSSVDDGAGGSSGLQYRANMTGNV